MVFGSGTRGAGFDCVGFEVGGLSAGLKIVCGNSSV